ncbi:MAG: TorF family putative porin [Gammaproteobacteria bacterium]
MTRSRLVGLALSIAWVLFAPGAMAQEVAAPDPFAGYVQFMSNYIGRGLAQSVGNPSVQGEFDYYSPSGFYINLDGTSINWIDQVYPGDSVSIEVDGILGYRQAFARDWLWKAGVLRLQFPGRYVPQSPPAARPDTTEVFSFIGWRNLGAKLNYAVTDSFGAPDSRGSWYLDLSVTQPVGNHWILGAHLGRKQSRGTNPVTGLENARFSYTDYKLSISRAFGGNLSLTLAWTWTNANPSLYTLNGYNVGGHHFAITLERDF